MSKKDLRKKAIDAVDRAYQAMPVQDASQYSVNRKLYVTVLEQLLFEMGGGGVFEGSAYLMWERVVAYSPLRYVFWGPRPQRSKNTFSTILQVKCLRKAERKSF